MRTLLDTSVLIGPAPTALEGELAISTISLAELHSGVLVASCDAVRAERLRRLGLVERTFSPLPVDAAVARAYGRLAAAVAGRPTAMRVRTLLVAATAVVHDARLCTRHPADLVGLEDHLEVLALS